MATRDNLCCFVNTMIENKILCMHKFIQWGMFVDHCMKKNYSENSSSSFTCATSFTFCIKANQI